MKISWTRFNDKSVTCAVIKDGGDDPDATHGFEICSTVQLIDKNEKIIVDGGIGVGRVTKPGLGLLIGSAAINPVPMKMIIQSVKDVLEINGGDIMDNNGLSVIISVPKGEEIAKKTDNPTARYFGRNFNSWNNRNSSSLFHCIFCSLYKTEFRCGFGIGV